MAESEEAVAASSAEINNSTEEPKEEKEEQSTKTAQVVTNNTNSPEVSDGEEDVAETYQELVLDDPDALVSIIIRVPINSYY